MKARIKASGYVAEVSLSHIVYDGGKKIMWYNTLQGASFTGDELEFIDTEENFDYWTRLEHQYAGMAIQGILANIDLLMSLAKKKTDDYPVKYTVAEFAKDCAHALVEKLKEKEEEK